MVVKCFVGLSLCQVSNVGATRKYLAVLCNFKVSNSMTDGLTVNRSKYLEPKCPHQYRQN